MTTVFDGFAHPALQTGLIKPNKAGKGGTVFGWRKTAANAPSHFHCGIDLVNRKGTPIYAVANGKVHRIFKVNGDCKGYGINILIKHDRVPQYGTLYSFYAHLDGIMDGIELGSEVVKGQQIALMGGTAGRLNNTPRDHEFRDGRGRTLVHLHFEMRTNPKDPGPVIQRTPEQRNVIDPVVLFGQYGIDLGYRGVYTQITYPGPDAIEDKQFHGPNTALVRVAQTNTQGPSETLQSNPEQNYSFYDFSQVEPMTATQEDNSSSGSDNATQDSSQPSPVTQTQTEVTEANFEEANFQNQGAETLDRLKRMSQGRTEPPQASKYPYFILQEPGTDSQAQNRVETDTQMIENSFDRFYSQANAMKSATTLEAAQTVPIIQISVIDGGELVNLNEKIFSTSPFVNYADSTRDALESGFKYELRDRPLASIESFSVTVQAPPAGGLSSFSTGRLTLKIHRPDQAVASDPVGKYISYMMRAGYTIRIRYGLQVPSNFGGGPSDRVQIVNSAFRWLEEDFSVNSNEISINEDKSVTMNLTLTPSHAKLLTQYVIGQSIPVQTLAQDGRVLTSADIDRVVDSVVEPSVSASDRSRIKEQLTSLTRAINNPEDFVGYRTTQNREDGTLSSVLHAAVNQIRIAQDSKADNVSLNAVVLENTIDGLKSIQGLLLSRKLEQLIEKNAYEYSYRLGDAEQKFIAISFGALFFELAEPEIKNIVETIAQNGGSSIGQIDSFDSRLAEARNRTNVKIIFDNFNEDAGQWGNKPISSFPINIEKVFSHIRELREVGKFGDTVQNFLSTYGGVVAEDTLYQPNNRAEENTQGQTRNEQRLEIPKISYRFYPDPLDSDSWIFLIFDQKKTVIKNRKLFNLFNSGASKEAILEFCADKKIPWFEVGHEGSFIKKFSAETTSDSLLATHTMLSSNSNTLSSRNQDSNPQIQGISREFLDGLQSNNEIIRKNIQILPIRVHMDHLMMTTPVVALTPFVVFSPMKQYDGYYQILDMAHEIANGSATTKMTLNINITSRNVRAD